ncbi:DUF1410 domain-containing protein [Ureaplasma parvum]|uniref:DUF1410 domain-containing protein n=1 Tax=Ureaplasma parvum TaxID=134821 RepID=UPI001151CA67|nr:DUF1410 domain-containing protein [Ureaplasma parvum]QDI64467.1 DUF1410 domain-containing protein [Ureaplasma parvum]
MKKNTHKKLLPLISIFVLIPLSSLVVMCSKTKTKIVKEQKQITASSLRSTDIDLTSINLEIYFAKFDVNDILVKKFSIELEDDKGNKINVDINPEYNKNLQMLSFKLENLKPNTTYKITKFNITGHEVDLTQIKDSLFTTKAENLLPDIPNLPNSVGIEIKDIKTNSLSNDATKVNVNVNLEINQSTLENQYARLVYKSNYNSWKLSNTLKIAEIKNSNFVLDGLISNRKYLFKELIIGSQSDLNLTNAQTKITTNNELSFTTAPKPVEIKSVLIDTKFDNHPSSLINLKFNDSENNLKENDILKIKYKKVGPNEVIFEKTVRLANNFELLFEIENTKKNEKYEILSLESNSKHGYNVAPSIFNFISNDLRTFEIKG